MNELFQVLKKDHTDLKKILLGLKATHKGDLAKREVLSQKLRAKLLPHMKAEERTFYEPMLARNATRNEAMEGREEHHVSDIVLKELEQMPKGNDEWGAKILVFHELLQHHIKDEETKIFKSAEKAFDQDEMHSIMMAFNKEKHKIARRLI